MYWTRRISVRRQQGAEVVEFAITLPVILLIFLLIVEFGVAFCDWAVVTNASRAAAREAIKGESFSACAASPCLTPCSGKTTCVCGASPTDAAWCAASAVWSGSLISGAWHSNTTPPSVTVSSPYPPDAGTMVTATVSYPLQFVFLPKPSFLPGVGPSLELKSVTNMSMLPH